MAHPKTGFVCVRRFPVTKSAGDAFLKLGMRLVRLAERFAAGEAHCVAPCRQPLTDRHAVIKNVAFPLPAARRCWNLFEILQNAALQMIHFGEAFL